MGPRARTDSWRCCASTDSDHAMDTGAPTTGPVSLTHLPDELLLMVLQKLDHESLLTFGPVSQRLHHLAGVAAEPVRGRLMEPWRREADAMLARLDTPVETIIERVGRASDGLDLLARMHHAHGPLLGPRDALPQRWELLRRLLAEVEDLAAPDMLHTRPPDPLQTQRPDPGILTPTHASWLIGAVQRMLDTAPSPLRVRGDPELPDGPRLPATQRLQAACHAMIRNHVKLDDARINPMLWMRQLASNLSMRPDQPRAVANLCFVASLWRHMRPEMVVSFIQFLTAYLEPFSMDVREAVAAALQQAGVQKLADERREHATSFAHLPAATRAHLLADREQIIEQTTLDAMSRVLTPGSGG
ncbi:F-box protein [Xylophilus sp. GOD-11R]|uniref:F-box protein n=1 Tax=Xylophilus sp. GOD-11R TaxID=3089814 RepID=UPI00298BD138|nr:F-box protein [Xylophilus sp. GOD-11R]WPB56148.1 F-box protein [Xylophilus sp. GOD-11R]